jgi:hypothetical protein
LVKTLFHEDLAEVTKLTEKANVVADMTTRLLLEILLPDKPEIEHQTIQARSHVIDYIESGASVLHDLFRGTSGWSELVQAKRSLEKKQRDEIETRNKFAIELLYALSFENLLPYFVDYKRKGSDYATNKWTETLPKKKLQVRAVQQREPGPEVTRVSTRLLRIRTRPLKKEDNDTKKT